MDVTQFLARLSFGPFANLAMSNDGDGSIDEARHAAVITHLNEALLKLYSKFDLSEKEIIVEQRTGKTHYKLHNDFAVSKIGYDGPVQPHIIDSAGNPFTNDLIKVLGVYLPGGRQLPLNDEAACNSVFTPQANMLQVPHPINGVPLYLVYQARHVPIIASDLAQEIDLPDVLEDAAISWVAYKVYLNMNGQEHTSKAADHLAAYKATCAEVDDRDLVNSSVSSVGTKFQQRGFV